jgi:hemerythrin-like domain-containing protein
LLLVHNVEAIPTELLSDPLSFLFAEHWRHRQFCGLLKRAAGMPAVPPGQLRRMADFLQSDMALHIEDEERDLFRLLRLRAAPEDELEAILTRLAADHRLARAMARGLCDELEAAAKAGVGPAGHSDLADRIARFVAHKMRHIALENAIVLPIARLRLGPADLSELAQAMQARRGS